MTTEYVFQIVKEIEDDYQSGFILIKEFSNRKEAEDFLKISKEKLILLEREETVFYDIY